MFKKGDKVRCIEDWPGRMAKDHIYAVVKDQKAGSNIVYVRADDGNQGGYFAYRFELVIDGPTDQELADDYRHMYNKIKIVSNELIARGYQITCIANREIQISKTTSITI